MRRKGKLKYRDVVGGPQKPKKLPKRKERTKKTYSLYKQSNKQHSMRRRFDVHDEQSEKRQKVEGQVEQSSESEEECDHLRHLQTIFASKLCNKQSMAIESSDDGSEDDGNICNSGNGSTEIQSFAPAETFEDDDLNKDEDDIEGDVLSNEDNVNDPFVKHVCYDLNESLLESLQSTPILVDNHMENWPTIGKLLIQIPHYQEREQKTNFSIEEKKKFAPCGTIPTRISHTDLKMVEKYFIKSQIVNNMIKANPPSKENGTLFTTLQEELFSIINNYQDVYYCERSFNNAEEIRFVYCLHAMNHILKTRLKILHHNSRMSKKDDVPEEFRDQGLVRPKVLVIVPFKESAYKIIQTLIDILLPDDKGHVMNKKRFLEEYTGNEIVMPKKNPKPEDYEQTFAGNVSDDFRIGLTVTKKSLKLYADFYSSDIIVASPLGLRTLIGAEGESDRDYDFLASVELLVMDQAEIFLMQNWDHVVHIMNHLHLQPKESHGTDFARVRTWSLNGWAKFYRQTLIFCSVVLPEINSIFNKKCCNYAGKVRAVNPVECGSINQVYVQVPHVFHKFEAPSAQEVNDARFDFFINKILPQQRDSLMKQTLIYVSSYFDYVRLRNYFKKEELSFVQICEYSKEGKIARARDMFFHGDAHFLLYTERHHFFNRIRIKGIRHLVFYQLPVFPHFYYEICNLMQENNINKKIGSVSNMTVNILYSKYDVHRLAAIVGTERATKMLTSDRKVHMMITGAD